MLEFLRKTKGSTMANRSSPPAEYTGRRRLVPADEPEARTPPIAPIPIPPRPPASTMSRAYAEGMQHVHDLEQQLAAYESARTNDHGRMKFLELTCEQLRLDINELKVERDNAVKELGEIKGAIGMLAGSCIDLMERYKSHAPADVEKRQVVGMIGEDAVANALGDNPEQPIKE